MGIRLDKAIQGLVLDMGARNLSEHTISDYSVTLKRLTAWCGADTLVEQITTGDLRAMLAHYSGAKVKPRGAIRRPTQKLSAKTIKNMHTALSAFWSYLVREDFVDSHVLKGRISPPKAEPEPIVPFSEEELVRILKACDYSWRHEPSYNGKTRYKRPTSARDRAIVMFLLDTGCRASELCGLQVDQVSLENCTAIVLGKGNKRREVVFSRKTGSALFKYLGGRDTSGMDPLFATRDGRTYKRENLLRLVTRLGKRAGVPSCYPHRFRHTFAIQWIRNGGDIYTLKSQLGHRSLDMVRRYLQIAGADVRQAHLRASPVDHVF